MALSNPPSKAGEAPRAPEAPVRSLGGSQGDLADRARGKGRSMLAFTPRVLATPAKGQVTTPTLITILYILNIISIFPILPNLSCFAVVILVTPHPRLPPSSPP